MKTKILVSIMSFIFLFMYSVNSFAVTNELIENDENIEDKNEIMEQDTEEQENTIEKMDKLSESEEIDTTELLEQTEEKENTNQKNETIENEVIEQVQINSNYEETMVRGNIKYEGRMYIEKPSNNQTCIRPDDNKISVVGWAVSEDTNAKVQILVDGKVVNSNVTRNSRGDVDSAVSPSYGGVAATPKAGFNTTIDITNLAIGSHKIKVQEISRYGDVICESEINISVANKKYSRKNVYRKTN